MRTFGQASAGIIKLRKAPRLPIGAIGKFVPPFVSEKLFDHLCFTVELAGADMGMSLASSGKLCM